MEFDGKSMGTSSVGRGLARARMGDRKNPDAGSDSDSTKKAEGGDGHSDHDHAGESGSHEAIQQVHSEHGPAHKVEVKHDGKHHHVTTHHEDGHVHESKGHPTVEHVHEHIGHSVGMAGGDSGGEEQNADGAAALQDMGLGSEYEG